MKLNVLYEDNDLIVVEKPPGIIVFPENKQKEKTLIEHLTEIYPELKEMNPPRYGTIHRLDKDTSGILLIAKNEKALSFYQEQFKKRELKKKYIALVIGEVEQGEIETLIGRSPKNRLKQKVYLFQSPDSKNKREAITEYKRLKKFKEYTLIEVEPKTGRKHQIRAHLTYLNHPIAGDKIYGFKNQITPRGLKRHFLHASYIRIRLMNNKIKEINSELPEDLKQTLCQIK